MTDDHPWAQAFVIITASPARGAVIERHQSVTPMRDREPTAAMSRSRAAAAAEARRRRAPTWWREIKGLFWGAPGRARLPQLRRQALLHPVGIDDAGAAQGRPAGGQQISLWLVVGVAPASTSARAWKGRLFGKLPERGDIVIVTPPGIKARIISSA
jgi:hypothetical protein